VGLDQPPAGQLRPNLEGDEDMAKYLSILAALLFLAACADVHPSDEMGSTVETPRDGEGDVDEPTIK
jgi:hypothetical protein